MIVRESNEADLSAVFRVHEVAFGGSVEAGLVLDLLADPSARPVLSLLAERGGVALGHVLFSAVAIDGAKAAILAPLAVLPGHQGHGIGGALVEAGLERLRDDGVGLVFVLGDPAYYGRFGFAAAQRHGLPAPYPIPAEYADAWMVLELAAGTLGRAAGTIKCADTLSKLEYWID